MKKANFLIIACIMQFLAFGQAANNRKIQIAILFDTSGSMDGLIEQAKSTIWSIVNTASTITYDGKIPELEIALYDYGNDDIKSLNYIRKHCDFISDLDSISSQLFALYTNGGSEYCAAVIQTAMTDLKWSSNPQDLHIIYIAGNEMFNQGPVDYKVVLKDAASKQIVVNTIYCGNYEQGVRELWFDAVQQGQGNYFNIDSNQEVVHFDTPYDKDINILNDSLNQTYIGYGASGVYRAEKQKKEDANALSKGAAVTAERAQSKSNLNYNNSSWDLVDGIKDSTVNLKNIKKEDLPIQMQEMTLEEREIYVKEKSQKRTEIQKQIGELSTKRLAYIEAEKQKLDAAGQEKDFGKAINQSIKTSAQAKGYTVK